MAAKITQQQRALWTFLISTLIAPFLAALVVLVAGSAIGVTGRWMPAEMASMDITQRMHWAGEHALIAFVWSAWPAALAGAAAAGLVMWRGGLKWLECAILGAVSAGLFTFVSGGPVVRYMLPIAFVGAVLGVTIWSMLTRARIVKP